MYAIDSFFESSAAPLSLDVYSTGGELPRNQAPSTYRGSSGGVGSGSAGVLGVGLTGGGSSINNLSMLNRGDRDAGVGLGVGGGSIGLLPAGSGSLLSGLREGSLEIGRDRAAGLEWNNPYSAQQHQQQQHQSQQQNHSNDYLGRGGASFDY